MYLYCPYKYTSPHACMSHIIVSLKYLNTSDINTARGFLLLILCIRYWAVAVPVYGMVLIVTTLVMYMGYSMWITPSLEDTRTITGKIMIHHPAFKQLKKKYWSLSITFI